MGGCKTVSSTVTCFGMIDVEIAFQNGLVTARDCDTDDDATNFKLKENKLHCKKPIESNYLH